MQIGFADLWFSFSFFMLNLLYSPYGGGHYALIAVVCVSIRPLSVCPDPKSRMEEPRKLKFDTK